MDASWCFSVAHIQSSKSDLFVHLITLTSLRSCLAAPGKSLIRAVVKGVVRQMGQDGVTSRYSVCANFPLLLWQFTTHLVG